MTIGFIVVHPAWQVVDLNAASEAVVGYKRDELGGLSYWNAFPADADNEDRPHLPRGLATGRPALVEAVYPAR